MSGHDLLWLLALCVGQGAPNEEAQGLHHHEGCRKPNDVVLGLCSLFVPHLLALVQPAVRIRNSVTEHLRDPAQCEDAAPGNREDSEHDEEAVWQLRLQHPEAVDGSEASYVPQKDASRLEVKRSVHQGVLVRLHTCALGCLEPGGALQEFRSRKEAQQDLQQEEPQHEVQHTHQELEDTKRLLPQDVRLHNSVHRLEQQHGRKDGDRRADDHPGVLPHVELLLVDKVEEAHHEADAA
mmetsp:Transcript_71564/g.165509  ORF Transcript_71564/g.165509 Transcript_71564/m.165509 type:complete len:238 (+) Transcript_71564:1017-1730(+)